MNNRVNRFLLRPDLSGREWDWWFFTRILPLILAATIVSQTILVLILVSL